MKATCSDMKRNIEQIGKELTKICAMEKSFSQGELICAKNGTRYKWYLKGKDGKVYLPKKKRKLAEKLAWKKYCVLKREELESELAERQNVPYEKSEKYQEDLVVKGTQGKMLRSKSEAIIDMMLYRNKIPFRYEEKLVLDGITFYPDFVLRHPMTGAIYYWEHFGLMDEEEYANHAFEKIKVYCKNGIIPSVNLIMTFETKGCPLSVEKVERIIQEYFLE